MLIDLSVIAPVRSGPSTPIPSSKRNAALSSRVTALATVSHAGSTAAVSLARPTATAPTVVCHSVSILRIVIGAMRNVREIALIAIPLTYILIMASRASDVRLCSAMSVSTITR